MAVVKNSILLDNARGKLGDFVLKKTKNRTILAIMPRTYTASKSVAAVRGRSNFAAAISLAKSVNSLPDMKKIWDMSDVDGFNYYQKMIKSNAKQVNNGMLTISNKITPDGLPISLLSAEIQNKNLNVTFSFRAAEFIDFPAKLYVFFYFNKYNKSVLSIVKSIESPSPEGLYTQNINLDESFEKALEAEPHPIIYLALSGLVPHKKKEYWTGTAAKQI